MKLGSREAQKKALQSKLKRWALGQQNSALEEARGQSDKVESRGGERLE